MNFSKIVAFFLLLFAVYWSYRSLMPHAMADTDLEQWDFQLDNALKHVKTLSLTQHAVGFPGHTNAMNYVVSELKRMGLQVSTQEGFIAGDGGNLCKATNIIAKIRGTSKGKALLLLSHYDSAPHSSYGASDAASGVATILEGVRALLANGKVPKNDIIILISDAEELGLNGAELFVHQHPWAKNVGLVLNFEARGSGGPSYMLIETNRGNSKLIKEFTAANPKYPVANSLAYSIYKMLPNDTDLTVFREDGDIEGFNFAFIDDHYDYHTALDIHERLDHNSLIHQASYLMPLMEHFAGTDLTDLKSLSDLVYFNIPVFKFISYPFEWIWPMFGLACILFVLLLILGFRKGELEVKSILIGFLPVVLILVINGLAGYYTWPILKWWYPWYRDILHGFTYNGHLYIMEMSLFAIAVCFFVYKKFKKIKLANLLVAPIVIWLLICGLVAVYLKGASFFIVPVFGLLAALLVFINQEKPNPLLLLFLCLPAVFMHSPFIQMFPVGLGLKMMVAATVLTSLLFFLTLPLLGRIKKHTTLGILALLLFAVYGIRAHLNASFSEEHPKPSSLLYVYHADTDEAQWASYDEVLIDWNAQFLKTGEEDRQTKGLNTLSSKYNTRFKHTAPAQKKNIVLPEILVTKDTVVADKRQLTVCVTPKRAVNRLEVFTNDIAIHNCAVNGVSLSEYYLQNRRNGKLITHFISNNAYTEIDLTMAKDKTLELSFYEASNDLLINPLFTVPERPKSSIPMPFVLNDAILVIKKMKFE
ncbi:M20/M25/M40 family metallo-hydrolase [Muricauda sp. SCSIO 64092]|uniref:M28 family peptidase n=1 Tax=Allomuricauda sp. SCSIO 64092 TaxID=2908842 RepID=UPI001FF39917|nr:M28 family peptidase [Muricauda sp. SCSIO 64092]UOY08466.1 M20/M25/M40 family metallo-hydrolase [Muricauda sp. SCSIO 64092]